MTWETVACDLCGSMDTRLLFQAEDIRFRTGGVFDLVKCLSCGLVYIKPRPDASSMGPYYPEGFRCFQSRVATHVPLDEDGRFASTVRRLGVRTGRLLDVGCGGGDFLVSAHLSGWQVAGVEPNEQARNRCNSQLGWEAVRPTLEEAGFPSETFEVVTLWHVLEHLHSPKAALEEIHRVLEPGGLIVIAVPNFGALNRRIRGRWCSSIEPPRHLYHFTRATLSRYLAQVGFVVERVYLHPGLRSLTLNGSRTARGLLLDWWRGPVASSPNSRNGVARRSKDSLKPTPTQMVWYPLASLVARMGLGSDITLYARKGRL